MISVLFADDGAAAYANGFAGIISNVLPLLLVFLIFFFLVIRPQYKKMKAHSLMISSIKKGDKVITSGGIIGTVCRLDGDSIVHLDICNGVEVKLSKSFISDIFTENDKT